MNYSTDGKTIKVCNKCKRELPANVAYFRRHSQTKDGLRNPCKECAGHKFGVQCTKGSLTENEGYKLCKGCLQEFPSSNLYFQDEKRNDDGLTGKCRSCIKEEMKKLPSRSKKYLKDYNKKYYLENKEFVNGLSKKYYYNNINLFVQYGKKYREEHIEEIKQYRKEYYRDNKKYIDNKNKTYRINNRDKINAYWRNYNKINKDKIREWNERYCLKHPERVIESRKKYRINNLEKVREQSRLHQQKRNALKRKLPSTLTIKQWEDIKIAFDNKCAYCGKKDNRLTQDHFIPLTKGGEYTHNNIIPACLSCNSSKRDYDFFEWYPKKRYYSDKRKEKIIMFLGYKNNKEQQLSIF